MRKKSFVRILLLLVLTAFGLTSCSQKIPSDPHEGETEPATKADLPETEPISYDIRVFTVHTDSYELEKLSFPSVGERMREEPVMVPVESQEMLNRLYESHDSRRTKGPAGWISEKSSLEWEKLLKNCDAKWFENQTLWLIFMDDPMSDLIRYAADVKLLTETSCELSARVIAPSSGEELPEKASGSLFFVYLPKTMHLEGVTVTNENGWKDFKNGGKRFGVTVSAEEWLTALSEADF